MCIGFCSELSSYELKLIEVILLHAQEFSIKNYGSQCTTETEYSAESFGQIGRIFGAESFGQPTEYSAN